MNILKEKSLMRLAEELGVSVSATKIIHDHAQPKVSDEFLEKWAIIFSAIIKGDSYEEYLKKLRLSIMCMLEELDIGLT